MPDLFISRHTGAQDWARRYAPQARIVEALDPVLVAAGDMIFGILPVDVAAEVSARGGRFFALVYDRADSPRGAELSMAELVARGAHLVEYAVVRVPE